MTVPKDLIPKRFNKRVDSVTLIKVLKMNMQMNNKRWLNSLYKIIGFCVTGLLLVSGTLHAQADSQLDFFATEDGRVYVIHANVLPLSHGFHVFRSDDGGDWVKLTDTPFFPVQNGLQVQQRMGSDYRLISNALPGRNPQAIFLLLQAGTSESLLTLFAFPTLSKAFGLVWVDESKPQAQRLAYKIVVVNDLNVPTGKEITGSGRLQTFSPPAVTDLTVENEGREVTLKWRYDTRGTERVFQFKPRYRITGDDRVLSVPDRQVFKIAGTSVFEYSFQIPPTANEFEFWIEAHDLVGQISQNNQKVTYTVRDNVPPPSISGVTGSTNQAQHAVISWPVSTFVDVAGYHVFRAEASVEEYEQLTTEPLSPLTTTFTDVNTQPATQYRYAVKVLGNNGLLSERSNNAIVSILDNRRPDPITDLNVVFDSEQQKTTINWNYTRTLDEPLFFRVLRRATYPLKATGFDLVNSESYPSKRTEDSNLGFEEGVTYEYAVAVFRSTGLASDTVYANVRIPIITPPPAPETITAEVVDFGRVNVAWGVAPSPALTGYRLYRAEVGAENKTLIQEAGRDVRFYRDEGLPLNSSWVYSVSAVDTVGNESRPVLSETVRVISTTPPQSAFNVQAVQTEEGILLAWQIRDAVETISSFNIYVSDIATGVFTKVGQAEATELRYLHTDGKAGNWYKIYPVNEHGTQAIQARATQARSR